MKGGRGGGREGGGSVCRGGSRARPGNWSVHSSKKVEGRNFVNNGGDWF